MIKDGVPRHLIDGALVGSAARFDVVDPATGEPFAHCPAADEGQLDEAVAAACKAFAAWSACSPDDRRSLLHRYADLLGGVEDVLAPLLTREQGKPLRDARAEVRRTVEHIKTLSAIPLEDYVLRADGRERLVLAYRPLGVVGAIAPWNGPLVLGMHKVAQALYTGNTIVLKPSPGTPLTTLAAAAIGVDLFPPGVLNVLAGGNDLGARITAHPDIARISFTGSVATGKKVMAAAASTLKRVTLELGGNDPALVLPDADLDETAAGIARSAFANCGQICMAVKRVYADRAICGPLVERLVAHARALRVGPGLDEGVTMGPIQNRIQFEKVRDLLARTRALPGAVVEIGGDVRPGPGFFVEPTIVTGLDDTAELVRDEQFGPVLPVLAVDSEDEAVARANASDFGLGASIWTRDTRHAAALAPRLEAGMVWVNRHGGNPPDVPFGGAKWSGIGREHGLQGLRSYMEMQVRAEPI